jgi:hypothetical protein
VETTVRPLPQESAGPRLTLLRAAGAAPELGWRSLLMCCAIGFFATMVASVAIQGARIQTQEQADHIASRMQVEQDRHRDLRVAVAQAESPGHILDAARGLGMVEPGPIAAVPADPAAAADGSPAVAPTTTAPSTGQTSTARPSTTVSTAASSLPTPSPGRAG